MCICGISILLQTLILNCYHVYPLREIPGWLKRMQACISSARVRGHKTDGDGVVLYSDGGNGQFNQNGAAGQKANPKTNESVNAKAESPSWPKRLQDCMSCAMACVPNSGRRNDVVPFSGDENGHIDMSGTVDHKINITDTGSEDAKTKLPPENHGMSHIDIITKKIQTDEVDENLRLEWKKLAKILDRSLFIIFAMIHLLMMLILFGAVPNI